MSKAKFRWYDAFLIALAIALGPQPASAQDYPGKPITMVVGFAAGGFADTLARLIGSKLNERLGQNVIIENRGGAGGNIAAAVAAKAPADGYTVLVTTTGISFYEVLNKNKTFALDELKVVAIPAWAPETPSVGPSYPAKTLAELIQAGRQKSISFGTPGAGTASHIAAAYFFKELAKIEVVHVPFQGGAPAVNAAVGGHVDALTGAAPGYAGQLQSGAIRGLAIASEKRLPQFPDIPTYGEGGFPTFKAATWVGFFVPGKTGDAVVARLNGAINDVLMLPDVRDKLAVQFMQTERRDAARTRTYFENEIKTWRTMITTIGLTLN
jgi:tripartite-type tricarboxylate transporter receptor subunit TctC